MLATNVIGTPITPKKCYETEVVFIEIEINNEFKKIFLVSTVFSTLILVSFHLVEVLGGTIKLSPRKRRHDSISI